MNLALAALVVAAFATAPAPATDKTDVMATVNQFVTGFNKGDAKSALVACDDQAIIIDDFAPHEWHGAGSCSRWMNEYDADAKRNAITDGHVTLGVPRHVDVSADHAYVVVPARYVYKQHGKRVIENGSILTVALKRGAAGWLITGWAWAKR